MTADQVAQIVAGDGPIRKNGRGWRVRCPVHDDRNPSLDIDPSDDGKVLILCRSCGAKGSDVVGKVPGLTLADLMPEDCSANGSGRHVNTIYPYRDETGAVLFEAVRYVPKGFRQRRADPERPGEWIWNVQGVRRVLFHLPELLAADPDMPVYVAEGEKDVLAIERAGGVATCNPMGAGKWREEYAEPLRGRDVLIVADRDDAGAAHAENVRASIDAVARSVRIVQAAGGKDAADHLAAGKTLEEFVTASDGTAERTTLAEVVQGFRRWLYLPDVGALLAALGAVAANRLEGDPIWLLLVAPAGWGKTEVIAPLGALADVHPAATLTEAALLSGTPAREKNRDSTGGLLRKIGDRGIILCKDFGSVLSMHRDARASVLAALREVYDGSWTRHVGTDGGRTLHWTGKVGMIAGCTPTIDRHHAVMSSMGERFCMYRLPEFDEHEQASAALRSMGSESEMRKDLAELVQGLIPAHPDEPGPFGEDEGERLIALARLATRARSAVERDGYSREIELIVGAEAPARLAKTLKRLHDGMTSIGVPRDLAWRVITRVAFDCVPAIRLRILRHLFAQMGQVSTVDIAKALGYPTQTTRRGLEDLAAYRLISRSKAGEHDNTADLWSLEELARELVRQCIPEMSGDIKAWDFYLSPLTIEEDFSGTRRDDGDWRDELPPEVDPDRLLEDAR